MSGLDGVSQDVDGETVSRYWPAEPFTVDGLPYAFPDGHPDTWSVHPRPMVWIHEDVDSFSETMFFSDPPTESELDQYVRDNVLPPT